MHFAQLSELEVEGYSQIPTLLPKHSKAYDLSGFHNVVSAYDMDICEWCIPELEFGKDTLSRSGEEIYNWLKENNYEYLIISGKSFSAFVGNYGPNTNLMIQKVIDDLHNFRFELVMQNEGMILLRLI
ncbi:MAG: hypothetical protein ABIJ00_11440 [Candidatus Eisenbacteria bacterium]